MRQHKILFRCSRLVRVCLEGGRGSALLLGPLSKWDDSDPGCLSQEHSMGVPVPYTRRSPYSGSLCPASSGFRVCRTHRFAPHPSHRGYLGAGGWPCGTGGARDLRPAPGSPTASAPSTALSLEQSGLFTLHFPNQTPVCEERLHPRALTRAWPWPTQQASGSSRDPVMTAAIHSPGKEKTVFARPREKHPQLGTPRLLPFLSPNLGFSIFLF